MTREELIEAIAKGMWDKHCQMYPKDSLLRGDWQADEDIDFLYTRFSRYAEAAIAAIEAAGVRLVPVDEKPGHGWLHEAVKDACLRAAKNTGAAPQMLFAPILWAMQDALAASPYAKDNGNE